jgi:heme-degrading monooxygenase HmoA
LDRHKPIESPALREEAEEWSGGATGAPPQHESGWIVHARTTHIQAQPSCIDAGIAHVRDEVMPALAAMDGFVGLSLLVDRESGRCIATSAWETEDAEKASAEQIGPLRDQAAQTFGGTATAESWEIGVLHRDHHSNNGACARVTWIKVPPDQAARALDLYKSDVLSSLESLEGFCSASFLMNRAGRAVSTSTFDSREAMERNREQAAELRNTRSREMGADVLDVGEFELAIAHLRVPEMV